MKNLKLLVSISSALLCLFGVTPSFAQTDNDIRLDEIVITGRNRDETLQDIPVSTSVISETLLEDAGITTLHDLFEMVPGLHFDEEEDRLAALPSIRGVQANDTAPNRTKVTSFIDGIPVLGSAGSIGFNGFQQVEVYRGPQSAAFGRSTFAGAINYVTRDPGDDFEGSVGINVSDFGTKTANISIGGPITDTLGFLLNYTKEDSSSPDEWHATGDAGYQEVGGVAHNIDQSDGTEFGARSGDNVSGKLVFQPDDTLKFSMTFNHVETHDQRAPVMFLDQDERDACFEGSGVFVNAGMMAPWLIGELDCDWDNARELYSQHDIEHYLNVNPLNLDHLVNLATNGLGDMGMADPAGPYTLEDGTVLSVEEQILLMAKAFSVPEKDRGTLSERDRFTFQVDKLLDNGSAVQFSYMQSDETFQRANATGFYYYDPDNFSAYSGVTFDPLTDTAVGAFDGVTNTFDMFSDGANIEWQGSATNLSDWRINSGMGAPRIPNPSFGEIEEQYAELRWVSPAEDRLRYVVGASYYDYEFLEERYGAAMGVEPLAGTAQFHGADVVDQYMQISGFRALGVEYGPDDEIIGEQAENMAAYFNAGYDITDQLTFSVEGRYSSDKVGATNEGTGISEEVTTKSFVPRVSLSYDLNENTSYYLQWANGINPAGINVGVLSADTIEILENGIPNGLIPYDATIATTDDFNNTTGLAGSDDVSDAYDAITGVWYTDGTQTTPLAGSDFSTGFNRSDFTSYKEEEISQLEFGFKGNLLDGRLTYSGALYSIKWKDQIQNGSIELDSPCADNGNAGDPDPIIGPCSADGIDYLYVGGSDGSDPELALNFGDVKIKGAEIEANYRITDNWDLRAQASIMKGEYDEFCDISLFNDINLTELTTDFDPDPADLPAARPTRDYLGALGLTIREPGEGETLTSTCYITNGNTLANQPEISWSLSPSFSTDISNMRFNARLDVRHEGKQYDNSGNFNWYPAATTANLNLTLSGDAWSTTFYVNNLTDENSPRNVFGAPDDTAQQGSIDFVTAPGTQLTGYLGEQWTHLNLARDSYQFRPRSPRSVGLRASYRF
jgi:outer membrane receptor protein involved in Fe transport